MKLNLDKIKEIALGVAVAEEENGYISLKRFTSEQEKLYKSTNDNFYSKTFSTSGVKLSFKTDSENLFLKIKTEFSSSRKYFCVDVFENGKLIGFIDNYSHIELPHNYTAMEFELGDFSKEFKLGKGEKHIVVHLPWSVKTLIDEISVDDNAFVEPVKQKKKLLAFGDSITHGYDALHPSNRYIARLAEKLEAEEFNKGIGGERFFPALAKLKDNFVPDYITVAYGTNDWSTLDEETFKQNAQCFYNEISKNYPNSKIFAITPIWRKDIDGFRKFGEFKKVEEDIKNAVSDIRNVTVISGLELVPGDESYFADLMLHPNDAGFEYYAENLYKRIKMKL